MERYRTLWLTERGLRHQQDAIAAAPPELDVVMARLSSEGKVDLAPQLAGAVFLVSERAGAIDAGIIAAAPKLKMIERLGSLAYDIDLEAARRAGIVVSLWPVRPVIMVAEHAMMQMLVLTRRLRETQSIALAAGDWGLSRRTDEDTFAYNWSARHGIDGLVGKTIGILGFGEIGAELARRLAGWECRVLYNRRRRLPAPVEAQLGIAYASGDDLLSASDVVVNLLPYFAETNLSLDAAVFGRMKPGALFCSCGSGSVVDETALAEAVRRGRLGGAALDTYEWEPLKPEEPLRILAAANPAANILLTPHVAAGAPAMGSIPSRARDYEPIVRFLRGEPVPHRLV